MEKNKNLSIFFFIIIYYLIVRYLFSICLPFLFAIVVYFMIQPMILFLEKYFHVYKSAIGISLLLVIYLFITFCIILMISHVVGLILSMPQSFMIDYEDNLLPFFYTLINFLQKHFLHFLNQDLLLIFQDFIGKSFVNIVQNLSLFLTHIPSYFFSFFIFIISTFFLVLEYDDIRTLIISHSSSQFLQTIFIIKHKTLQTLYSYLKCQLILMLLCFVVLSFMFSILHFSSPFLMSLFVSLLDSLPFIGVGIILVPMSLFYFIQGFTLKGIYIFIVYLFLNVIRNLLEPQIMNKELKIPSFLLLLSMVIHFYLFGVMGVFLSPIHMSLFYAFLDYRHDALSNA